jgi:NAD(P)-dependent dehydrogenase (short-subunit alcohol dehydrogenase family)
MNVDLTGKVGVVTGAGQGIGRAYAQALADAGAAVAVAEIDTPNGEETAKLITDGGGRAIFVQTDVANEASTRAMGEAVAEQLGGVDILVNNAGLWGAVEKGRLLEVSLEYWNKVMAINLTGMMLCSQATVPSMIERGGGAIVNQSSIGAYLGGAVMPHYCTSKGAVNALTKTMAKDFGPHGIRVNAIAPGSIATEASKGQLGEAGLEKFIAQQCLQRQGDTDDLTGPLLFLVSELSKFVTGQVLVVDGGIVMLG